jgi:DNA invertase Pin-like site-specific DNA recombinase
VTYAERTRLNQLRRQVAAAGGPAYRTLQRHPDLARPQLRDLLALFREGRLIPAKRLAPRLQVSRSTIYRWIDEGRLEALKLHGKVFVYLDQPVPVSWK